MTTFAADPFGICFLFGIFALFAGRGNNMLSDVLQDQEYTADKDNQLLLSIVVLILLATSLFYVTYKLDHYAYARDRLHKMPPKKFPLRMAELGRRELLLPHPSAGVPAPDHVTWNPAVSEDEIDRMWGGDLKRQQMRLAFEAWKCVLAPPPPLSWQ